MGLRLGFLVILLLLTRTRGGAVAGSEAYVTLLYGDEFLLGVCILGKSIRDTGSTKDMDVLVSDGISNFTKRLLQSSTSPRGAYGCNSYSDAGGNANRYDDVRYGYKDDDWNRHGRERDYGYSDDDRFDKGGYSQSWDGDRYGRVNEDHHGRDGYQIQNTCITEESMRTIMEEMVTRFRTLV